MKKLLAIVLVMIMILSLAILALASSFGESTGRTTLTKDKAIIIIPGFAGTSLKVTSGVYSGIIAWYNSDKPWLPACTETGNSIYSISTYTSGQSAYGIFGMYYYLFNNLNNSFSSTHDILFFPYDWRMSNTNSAAVLQAFINNRGYQEVILVAHSMGGLVASSYLCNATNRAKVDKLITLGTPYLGSPAILYAMETGVFFPETVDYLNTGFEDIINNYPSAYETLPPSRDFLNYVINGSTTISGFTATNSFLSNRPWARKENGSTKAMLAGASTYHSSLMINGSQVTDLSSIEVYRIHGMGEETIEKVVYSSNGDFSHIITATHGDGTVPYLSAINDSSAKPRKHFFTSHNGLVQNQEVINYIIQCINGTAVFSANSEIEVNDRGWLIGPANRRITVIVDGPGSFLDILNSTVICTSAGEKVSREKNKLYVERNDGSMEEVGTIWEAGGEAVQFFMRNGEYVFNITTKPDSIVVEYSDGGYYERVLKYNLLDASSARLTVSNYDSQDVRCVKTVLGIDAMYNIESLLANELPEDQLFDYKSPN